MESETQALDANGLYLGSDAGKMTTWSGIRLNPLHMTPDLVDIEDIAHALSRQCRYNGHVNGFFSVARHCVWVAERLESQGHPREVVLAGLLHDAAEAYLGDMIRPLKHGELGALYLSAEAKLEAVIADALGVEYPFHPAVTEADNWVLLNLELAEGGARQAWDSTPDDDRALYLDAYYDLAAL